MSPTFNRLNGLVWSLLAVTVVAPAGQSPMPDAEWPAYARTNASTRYSPLDQINKSTVGKLQIAWRQSATPTPVRQGRPAPPALPNYQNTPVMVGSLLYISTGYGTVAALDASTGNIVWFDAPAGDERPTAGARDLRARSRLLDRWKRRGEFLPSSGRRSWR